MSSKKNHLNIINHNFSALNYLSKQLERYTDWCITIIFYMALHYIHAYLSQQNEHPTSHSNLDQLIAKNPKIKKIRNKYRHLYDDSRQARYYGNKLSIYEMRNSSLKYFNEIQQIICELLKHKPQHSNLYDLFPLNS